MDWDEPLTSTIQERWNTFINSLRDMATLKFPRWLGIKASQHFEIHEFSDASISALAVVVYSRIILANGTVGIQVICSKTKVAPLKKITVPLFRTCYSHISYETTCSRA